MVFYSLMKRRKTSRVKSKAVYKYKIDEWERENWNSTFSFDSENYGTEVIPFTYYERPGVLQLIDYLINLGIKGNKIYHIRSDVNYTSRYEKTEKYEDCFLEYEIDEIFVVKDYRACIKGHVFVRNDKNEIVIAQTDYFYAIIDDFFINEYINKNNINSLESVYDQIKDEEGILCRQKDWKRSFPICKGFGYEYAQLSGDYNPWHCSESLFKPLRKGKKAYIQGYCILNIIIKTMFEEISDDVRSISMSIKDKVYTQQDIHLLFNNERYEILDDEGKLLVYGDVKTGR